MQSELKTLKEDRALGAQDRPLFWSRFLGHHEEWEEF